MDFLFDHKGKKEDSDEVPQTPSHSIEVPSQEELWRQFQLMKAENEKLRRRLSEKEEKERRKEVKRKEKDKEERRVSAFHLKSSEFSVPRSVFHRREANIYATPAFDHYPHLRVQTENTSDGVRAAHQVTPEAEQEAAQAEVVNDVDDLGNHDEIDEEVADDVLAADAQDYRNLLRMQGRSSGPAPKLQKPD